MGTYHPSETERLGATGDGLPCRMGPLREIPRDEAAPFLRDWHYMTYVPNKTSLRFYGYEDAVPDGSCDCVCHPINTYTELSATCSLCGNNPGVGHPKQIACIIALNHRPTNQHVARLHFGDDWKALNIGELSRMACRDECPTLTESMFLSRVLKLVRRLGYDAMISYADMAEEHEGGIYKATNWTYTGLRAPNEKYFVDTCITGKGVEPDAPHEEGCKWPDTEGTEVNWRQCRHKWNSSHGAGLRRVLGNRIRIEPGFGKHRFVYPLTRRAKAMLRPDVIESW